MIALILESILVLHRSRVYLFKFSCSYTQWASFFFYESFTVRWYKYYTNAWWIPSECSTIFEVEIHIMSISILSLKTLHFYKNSDNLAYSRLDSIITSILRSELRTYSYDTVRYGLLKSSWSKYVSLLLKLYNTMLGTDLNRLPMMPPTSQPIRWTVNFLE